MNKCIGRVLEERFVTRDASFSGNFRKKSGIDIALEDYPKESGRDMGLPVTMNAEFRRFAIDDMPILLFAGHNTKTPILFYCYHLPSKHPGVLASICKELDDVFGAGVSGICQLKNKLSLINKCNYTLAIIKETLRLRPSASSFHVRRNDYFIKDPATSVILLTNGPVRMPAKRFQWFASSCLTKIAWNHCIVDVPAPHPHLRTRRATLVLCATVAPLAICCCLTGYLTAMSSGCTSASGADVRAI
jgi:hypothetical protein